MKTSSKILSIILFVFFGFSYAHAQSFGISLKIKENDADRISHLASDQRDLLREMYKNGTIKDMYIKSDDIGQYKVRTFRLVLQSENVEEAKEIISSLPMVKSGEMKLDNIVVVGEKWLDNTPLNNNYGLTFTWKDDIELMEIDRVLGIDLQEIITLNQVGTVSSSFINIQEFESKRSKRPTYLISILAKDEQQANMISQKFESVRLGYADVTIVHMGRKFEF
ncbi:hypothetical protein [Vibrio coralliirubri]|uniref:hypothetical protein n=1 Tax=Vibrio coralliirubri TaxID=1516159 RepID=UPI00062E922E|nr:hypothetical protein [Vibrio coralliirubri]CDT20173.1 conserved exported hypothetical protein [Vibrio coralliirubri]CDT60475.1 conserved exported hypothetical protein [Vibrio coralliirubri]CDT78924.1 conserved exported hypothetical protein [Vibrio coralliirubri]CDT91691.1 conserved exported hypothetical protein [Vibrio coralliirubri]